MSRSIPPWLSEIVERLELDRPEIITTRELEKICNELGIVTPARIIASRLKERGWLLDTPQRGVWEFVPGETAGAISKSDPLLPVKAFSAANPKIEHALAQQSAAWALGLADRMPATQEVAFASRPKIKIPSEIKPLTYQWRLEPKIIKGVPVLQPESILVQMVHRPNSVRSWHSALDWLPDITYEIETGNLFYELEEKPASTWSKTGYLLQGMRPDIAEALGTRLEPKSKVRFGTSDHTLRNDESWMVSDYLLPFDPRDQEPAR